MFKNKVFKNILLGFFSWAIPFAVSFLFYKPGGELVVAYATFKSAITAVGAVSGCYLLYRYFSAIEDNFTMNGVIVGLSWFAINIFLDGIILIPMMKITFVEYFMTIGLSYLSIPAISITIGYLLHKKLES